MEISGLVQCFRSSIRIYLVRLQALPAVVTESALTSASIHADGDVTVGGRASSGLPVSILTDEGTTSRKSVSEGYSTPIG